MSAVMTMMRNRGGRLLRLLPALLLAIGCAKKDPAVTDGAGGGATDGRPPRPAVPLNDGDVLLAVDSDPGVSLDPTRAGGGYVAAASLRLTLDALVRRIDAGELPGAPGRAVAESVARAEPALLAALLRGTSIHDLPAATVLDTVAEKLGVPLNESDRSAALSEWRAQAGPAADRAGLDRNRNGLVADDLAAWFIARLCVLGKYDPAPDVRLVATETGGLAAVFGEARHPADWTTAEPPTFSAAAANPLLEAEGSSEATVPEVELLSVEDAVRAVRKAGLVPVFVDDVTLTEIPAGEAKGEVMRQGLPAGASARKGGRLLLSARDPSQPLRPARDPLSDGPADTPARADTLAAAASRIGLSPKVGAEFTPEELRDLERRLERALAVGEEPPVDVGEVAGFARLGSVRADAQPGGDGEDGEPESSAGSPNLPKIALRIPRPGGPGGRPQPATKPGADGDIVTDSGTVVIRKPPVGKPTTAGNSRPDRVRIPDLAGETYASAERRLRALDLRIRDTDAFLPGDKIVRSEPAAKTWTAPQNELDLHVTRETPALTGLTLERARKALADAKLNAAVADRGELPTDFVLRQKPEAGEPLGKGATVTVWLERAIPDVAGKPFEDAVKVLADAAFAPVHSPELRARDVILSQVPAGAERAPPGTRVSLTGERTVPDLTGRRWAEAEAALRERRLVARLSTRWPAPSADVLILSQEPKGGHRFPVAPDFADAAQNNVALTPGCKVPNVRGKPLDEALDELEGANFVSEIGDGFIAGAALKVLAQDGVVGGIAAYGTRVRLKVGPDGILVPDVRGKSLADAIDALHRAGLAWKRADAGRAFLEDQVVEQTPPPHAADAPSVLPRGRQVALTVQVKVPSVVGLKLGAARDRLAAWDFKDEASPAAVADDVVAAQRTDAPDQPFRPRGSRVSLTVTRALPDVKGKRADDAAKELERAGFPVADRAGVPSGGDFRVMAQEPGPQPVTLEPATAAADLPTVRLDIGAEVPKLVGDDFAGAAEQLRKLRLRVEPESPPSGEKFRVTAQSVRPGEVVALDGVVALTLQEEAKPPPLFPPPQPPTVQQVKVPNVLRLDPHAAERELRRAGLEPAYLGGFRPRAAYPFVTKSGNITTTETARVAEQTPAAGEVHPRGTQVRLKVTVGRAVESINTIKPGGR